MLRECQEHGYFRGELCPICGDAGRFLMNDQELEQIGRTMAGALRHFPEKFGLTMDEQGFVNLRDFIAALKHQRERYHWIRPHHIIAIVETDPKGRYQVSNDLIRATYGHSLPLNLNLPTDNIPETLYYPTTPEEADILLERLCSSLADGTAFGGCNSGIDWRYWDGGACGYEGILTDQFGILGVALERYRHD